MLVERDLYNVTSERLWEKLEYYRNNINTSCVDFKEPFLIDQLTKNNPLVEKLIKEVENEFGYIMSEFQCSWAVLQFIKGSTDLMKTFNDVNGTKLQPRI